VEPFLRMLAHLREPVLLVTHTGTVAGATITAAEALRTTTPALAGTALLAHVAEPAALDARLVEASRLGGAVQIRTLDGRRFSAHPSVLDDDLLLVRLTGGPEPASRARGFFSLVPRALEGTVAESVEELARALLPFGMQSVGARQAGIYLLDDTGSTLELVGSLGYPEVAIAGFRLVAMTTPLPLTDCVRGARPIFLLSSEGFATQYPGLLDRVPVIRGALVCIPLVENDKCIGAIGLGAPAPWDLRETDREFLDVFALQCAASFARARRADQERVRGDSDLAVARLERLHTFTGALARALTPSQVAEGVVDAGMAATDARSGGLWLVDEDGGTVTLARSVGPTGPRPELHQRVPLDRSVRMPILDAIRDGAPVWIESCRQLELRYPEIFSVFSRAGESSLVCLPLVAQNRCLGGLALNFDHSHQLLEYERAFFEVIAWYAAQAIERARLYAAEQRARAAAEMRHRRSEFLAASDNVLATLDPQSILLLASKAVPHIADCCAIILDDELRRGIPPTVTHVDPNRRSQILAIHERNRTHGEPDIGLRAALRTGRAQLAASVTPDLVRSRIRDPELADLYIASGVTSWMVAPIAVGERKLGALLLCMIDSKRSYDEDDLAMAEDLGRKVGLALDNARLYLETREDDRLKDEFLAMLSHELRNPLVPMVAAINLMDLEDNGQFEQERGLIRRSTQHLVRLVDDLLDVSRITRGNIALDRTYCELMDLVREAIDISFPVIEERGHRLLFGAPPRRVAVLADRIRMIQAIANLLTNAAKYTARGGTITLSIDSDADLASVSVSDTGIGIEPDLLPRVFDIFVQGPAPSRGGLGIGLTVVKRIVELHGGTVSAASTGPAQGSEFVIRLPLADTPKPLASTPRPTTLRSTGERRALVVDDNLDAAEAIAHMMSASGFIPRVAHDGHTALEAAAEVSPELALIDLGMPGMDGFELARRLRDLYPSLRLIAVTGFGRASDRALSSEAGFNEHIIKPVTLDELRRIIASRA